MSSWCGTNDLGNKEAKDILSNIIEMHSFVTKTKKAKCCIISIPEHAAEENEKFVAITKKREEINKRLKVLAEENTESTLYCDITKNLFQRGLSKEERDKLWCDRLHFTPKGYDIMGEEVFNTIKDWI